MDSFEPKNSNIAGSSLNDLIVIDECGRLIFSKRLTKRFSSKKSRRTILHSDKIISFDELMLINTCMSIIRDTFENFIILLEDGSLIYIVLTDALDCYTEFNEKIKHLKFEYMQVSTQDETDVFILYSGDKLYVCNTPNITIFENVEKYMFKNLILICMHPNQSITCWDLEDREEIKEAEYTEVKHSSDGLKITHNSKVLNSVNFSDIRLVEFKSDRTEIYVVLKSGDVIYYNTMQGFNQLPIHLIPDINLIVKMSCWGACYFFELSNGTIIVQTYDDSQIFEEDLEETKIEVNLDATEYSYNTLDNPNISSDFNIFSVDFKIVTISNIESYFMGDNELLYKKFNDSEIYAIVFNCSDSSDGYLLYKENYDCLKEFILHDFPETSQYSLILTKDNSLKLFNLTRFRIEKLETFITKYKSEKSDSGSLVPLEIKLKEYTRGSYI